MREGFREAVRHRDGPFGDYGEEKRSGSAPKRGAAAASGKPGGST